MIIRPIHLEAKWWLYVVKNTANNLYYIGISHDPNHRLEAHRNGESNAAKQMMCDSKTIEIDECVFVGTYVEASKMERWLRKTTKGKPRPKLTEELVQQFKLLYMNSVPDNKSELEVAVAMIR